MPSFKSEFDRSTGSRRNALIAAISGICLFIVLPLVLLVPIWSFEGTADLDGTVISILDILKNILILYIVFGIPLIVLKTLKAFYPEGSQSRLTFYIVFLLYTVAWLWIVTSGGTVSAGLDLHSFFAADEDLRIVSLTLTADLTWFLVILSLLGILRCIIPIGEYKGSREKYLSEHPDTDEDEKPIVYTRH